MEAPKVTLISSALVTPPTNVYCPSALVRREITPPQLPQRSTVSQLSRICVAAPVLLKPPHHRSQKICLPDLEVHLTLVYSSPGTDPTAVRSCSLHESTEEHLQCSPKVQ